MSNPFALDTPAATPAAVPPAQFIAPPAAPVNSATAVSAAVDPQYAAWLASQQAAASAPAPVASAADPFDDGDPFSGPAPQRPRGPRMRELHGRLLLLRPLSVEKVKQTQDDGTVTMQDRMTTDVIVLDGGTIAYGGTPEKLPPVPHNQTAETPFKIDSMFISSVGIVSQCRDALERRRQGKPGMVLGRLTTGQAKSDKHNPPYLLTPPTDADKATGRAYLASVDPFA